MGIAHQELLTSTILPGKLATAEHTALVKVSNGSANHSTAPQTQVTTASHPI